MCLGSVVATSCEGESTEHVLPLQALTNGLMGGQVTNGTTTVVQRRLRYTDVPWFCCHYKLQGKKHRTCASLAGVDERVDGWVSYGTTTDGNGPPPDNYQYATGNSRLELVQTLLVQ